MFNLEDFKYYPPFARETTNKQDNHLQDSIREELLKLQAQSLGLTYYPPIKRKDDWFV